MKSINKKILGIINYLRFEKVIIKLSRIHTLKKLYNQLWEDKSFNYFEKKYLRINSILEKSNFNLRNKTILEIGSGNSVGIGFFLYSKGFNLWDASDLNRKPKMNKELDLTTKCNKKYNTNIPKRCNKFKFVKLDITKYKPSLDAKYDLIISNATLEHVPLSKIPDSISNMYKYLKKNGLMIHQIDFRNHLNFENPFDFYKYSNKKWELLIKNSIFYTNRLRVSDFEELFKKNNFKILIKEQTYSILPKKIHVDLKNYTNNSLRTKGTLFVLRKN